MTINYRYWERDHERYHARQVEKEALESHSQKQGKTSISSSTTVKIIDGGLYFYFLFSLYFIFLFLEQLRLGFISHAVTSVTS